jgi:hypothetical protein
MGLIGGKAVCDHDVGPSMEEPFPIDRPLRHFEESKMLKGDIEISKLFNFLCHCAAHEKQDKLHRFGNRLKTVLSGPQNSQQPGPGLEHSLDAGFWKFLASD